MFIINRKNYEKIIKYFKHNKKAKTLLEIIYKLLPLLIFISYPVLLVWVWIVQREMFLKILLLPACVFALVTVLRIIINEHRPYEKYGIPSVFNKKTVGKSMPSRHTASAFIISMSMLSVDLYLGITFLMISGIVAISRILSGVHYIRDVLVGAGISIVCGIIFIFLL